jgi:predicted pyridoxine 5'-phosphate oxidase superfamily flavin-nucleotide-binding protein
MDHTANDDIRASGRLRMAGASQAPGGGLAAAYRTEERQSRGSGLMTPRQHQGPKAGFHEGEIAVQRLAGVREAAQPLVAMLDPAGLGVGAASFLAQQTFIVLTARDQAGTLWTSPLTGARGFLKVTGPRELHVATVPASGDPLHGLPGGQEVGLVAMEFARRRRLRVNGHLGLVGNGLSVEVEQAYGNCPQYIQQRILTPADPVLRDEGASAKEPELSTRLSEEDIAQIRAADTFFLGTTHPDRGSDASHRGGPAGFVHVEDDQTLWWPDYRGNNMFNSLGNVAVDPTAALLFIDFATGRTLHLNGHAALEMTARGAAGDDGQTGRRVRFHVATVAVGARLPQRAARSVSYPRNPSVTTE